MRILRRPSRGRLAALATLVTLGPLAACEPGRDDSAEPPLSLADVLAGADTAGYERATAPRPFVFPADHGPHPSFRSEWWYVTGNLSADDGRDFGFQLTIFRGALAPEPPEIESDWTTNQAYLAHFTVTDVAGRRFHAHERYARGAAGLAGAAADPLRVWLGDWSLEGSPVETFPIEVTADADGVAIHLELLRGKPPVLQGEEGLSQKGPETGNASYYYSLTRLPASGTLVLSADTLRVSGAAWIDREWSTSALPEGVAGWDWLALQLDDGWDVMVYRLRRADGSAAPFSRGTLVSPSGESEPLGWGTGVTFEATGAWHSPLDGTAYPAGWLVRLPGRGWELAVEPRLADQELALSFRYWEGAVSLQGSGEGGARVRGSGYVELTGYADPTGSDARTGPPRARAPSGSSSSSRRRLETPRGTSRSPGGAARHGRRPPGRCLAALQRAALPANCTAPV